MRSFVIVAAGLLLCGSALAVEPDKNAAKLEKEIRKVNDVASVIAGRRVVNQVVSDQTGISRKQLVAERRQTGLAYGQLFAVHEIASEGNLKFDDLAAEVKQGHSVPEIAARHEVKAKSVLDETKKLNKEIAKALADDADESEDAPDAPDASDDSYDPSSDSEPADTAGMTPQELAKNAAAVQSQGAAHASANAQGLGLGRSNPSGGGSMGPGGMGGMSSPGNSGSARGGRRGPG